MAKKTVDIAAMLGKQFADVPKSDTSGREQLRYIGIGQLDDDPNNFYSLEGLEELAGNIQLCGLQQPLRVRPAAEGRYTIVSGHRRRAALGKLVEEGQGQYREIPCIVERGEDVSPAMGELRLICANSDSRQLSSGELAKQAERVEALLYQLKEEGVAFPGRMRDHVAQACKVSKGKPDLDIAEQIGCSKATIAKWRKSKNLAANYPKQRASRKPQKRDAPKPQRAAAPRALSLATLLPILQQTFQLCGDVRLVGDSSACQFACVEIFMARMANPCGRKCGCWRRIRRKAMLDRTILMGRVRWRRS